MLDKALDLLLEHEGGWSNHRHDRGGATMYGVTQSTYNSWRRMIEQPTQTVAKITMDEARRLYEEMYWKAASCDKLPWPISYLVFDAAVNSGPVRSKKWLQQALGVADDGIVGPHTLAAVGRADIPNLVRKIIDARVVFLARLVRRDPSQLSFLLGWWRRTIDVAIKGVMA